MKGLTPFLWFATEAEEAANYYVGIFPDAEAGEVHRFPKGGHGPEGGVMTASFRLAGQTVVALNGNPRFKFSPAMSLMYTCRSEASASALTEKLAAGGQKQPGGWLLDKYGVSWQIHMASG
jgi:predicted 3-demethylubiquinone-9 3-methyltransferase (glyoxalase superfamily)